MERKEIKGKKSLAGLGYVSLGLSLALLVLSIVCFAFGSANKNVNIGVIVGGICLLLCCIAALVFGIYSVWISSAIVATKGSLKSENLAKGTVNIKKCDKCGKEANWQNQFCSQCQENLSQSKICSACLAENKADAKFCCKCGKEIV